MWAYFLKQRVWKDCKKTLKLNKNYNNICLKWTTAELASKVTWQAGIAPQPLRDSATMYLYYLHKGNILVSWDLSPGKSLYTHLQSSVRQSRAISKMDNHPHPLLCRKCRTLVDDMVDFKYVNKPGWKPGEIARRKYGLSNHWSFEFGTLEEVWASANQGCRLCSFVRRKYEENIARNFHQVQLY